MECLRNHTPFRRSFPGGSAGKESTCNPGDEGDACSIPGWGRSPGGGHGNPLQYPCLKNSTERGAWWATVHRIIKSQTQLKHRSTHTGTPFRKQWIISRINMSFFVAVVCFVCMIGRPICVYRYLDDRK